MIVEWLNKLSEPQSPRAVREASTLAGGVAAGTVALILIPASAGLLGFASVVAAIGIGASVGGENSKATNCISGVVVGSARGIGTGAAISGSVNAVSKFGEMLCWPADANEQIVKKKDDSKSPFIGWVIGATALAVNTDAPPPFCAHCGGRRVPMEPHHCNVHRR